MIPHDYSSELVLKNHISTEYAISPKSSRRHRYFTIRAEMAADSDAAVLAQLGYKQELKRAFKPHEVFGIGFSIIGIVPSIA